MKIITTEGSQTKAGQDPRFRFPIPVAANPMAHDYSISCLVRPPAAGPRVGSSKCGGCCPYLGTLPAVADEVPKQPNQQK